jgi:hypothetical protein
MTSDEISPPITLIELLIFDAAVFTAFTKLTFPEQLVINIFPYCNFFHYVYSFQNQ